MVEIASSTLLWCVCGSVGLMALYLLVWALVDPVAPASELSGAFVLTFCRSRSNVWALVPYAVEAAALAYGIHLCMVQADVVPAAISESSQISEAILNTAFLGSVMLLLSYPFESMPDQVMLTQALGVMLVLPSLFLLLLSSFSCVVCIVHR